MKKNYKFGEMILSLREEYKECKKILNKLESCIKVENGSNNYYFTGLLSDNHFSNDLSDRLLRLYVETKYLDILKKIQYLKYDWYSQLLYSAYFDVQKGDNNLYELDYDDIPTPVDAKKYIPKVEIIDQNKFSLLIDKLLATDLMQLKYGYFSNNNENISLDFDDAYISSTLGNGSLMTWNGVQDNLEYFVARHSSPALIKDILSLKIPTDKITPDWLKLLEKHEKDFSKDIYFDIDEDVKTQKGVLQISDMEHKRVIKLVKNK